MLLLLVSYENFCRNLIQKTHYNCLLGRTIIIPILPPRIFPDCGGENGIYM